VFLAGRASESDGRTDSWRVKILRNLCRASEGSIWESDLPNGLTETECNGEFVGGCVADTVPLGQGFIAVLRVPCQ